jgi:hypothetical protein
LQRHQQALKQIGDDGPGEGVIEIHRATPRRQ